MRILLYLAIGLTVGSASGALGIGGGILLVPALIWLCQMAPSQAAGTSLAVLMVPVCLPAAWQAMAQGRVDLAAAAWIAAAFAVGGVVGASAVPHLPERAIQLCFGVLLIALGVRFLGTVLEEAPLWSGAAALTAGLLGLASRRPTSATETLDYSI